jgi:hypothetical protein
MAGHSNEQTEHTEAYMSSIGSLMHTFRLGQTLMLPSDRKIYSLTDKNKTKYLF